MGSKDAVLVFRTSVLSENATNLIHNDLVDMDMSSSTSSAEDFNPAKGKSCESYESPMLNKRDSFPVIANSGTKQSSRRLEDPQQTKENKSDNPEPKSSFKHVSPTNNANTKPNRSDMPGSILQMQYRFLSTESRLLRKILHSHGIRESEDEQLFNILWSGSHLKPDVLRGLTPYQRVNHFPR